MRQLVPSLLVALLVSCACTGAAGRSDAPRAAKASATSVAVLPRGGVVAALKMRPLRLPGAGKACPASAVAPLNLTWDGPTGGINGFATRHKPIALLLSEESVPISRVRLHGALYVHQAVVPLGPSSERGWGALKTVWLSEPSYQGPVLVRGRRLAGSGIVGVGDSPTKRQFVLPSGPDSNGGDGYRPGIGYVWLRKAGCYGFQIDGTNFSYHVVVLVLPQARAPN